MAGQSFDRVTTASPTHVRSIVINPTVDIPIEFSTPWSIYPDVIMFFFRLVPYRRRKHTLTALLFCFQSVQVPHDIAISKDGSSLYVASINPNRIMKYTMTSAPLKSEWFTNTPNSLIKKQNKTNANKTIIIFIR